MKAKKKLVLQKQLCQFIINSVFLGVAPCVSLTKMNFLITLKFNYEEVKFVRQILRAPCEWCQFGLVFNGQLGHLYKLGDWKTAES